jgi:hypothetical protein
MLKNRDEIEDWLYKHGLRDFIIENDFTVNVYGSVNLDKKDLHEIPVQFGMIKYDFRCSNNHLTSLKGCPYHVGRDFDCSGNNLTSWDNFPPTVEGDIICSVNTISSIKELKSEFGGHFVHKCKTEKEIPLSEFLEFYNDIPIFGKLLRLTKKEINVILAQQELDQSLSANNAIKNRKIKI